MIIFYTTHCPQCKVLQMKLDKKNIEYEERDDIQQMESLGLTSAPVLDIDGEIYRFAEAVKWVNEQ